MERIVEDDVKEEYLIYTNDNLVRVSQVRHLRTGQILCMKKLYVDDIQDASFMQREYVAMATMKHPNIISLKAVSFGGTGKSINSVIIFMEYFPEGDLDKLIRLENPFPEDLILSYMEQLLSACSYMESHQVAHRDIKPQNILICNQGKTVKIADLGSATKREGMSKLSIAGTPLYLSPKLRKAFQKSLQSVDHDVFKSDVYSLGLTFLYMTSLRSIRDLTELKDLQENIDKRIEDLDEKYQRVKIMLRCMLKVQEAERLNFTQLLDLFENVKNYVSADFSPDVCDKLPEPEEKCVNCNIIDKKLLVCRLGKGWICNNCLNSFITVSSE